MINWVSWDKAGQFRQWMMNPRVGLKLRHCVYPGDFQVTEVDLLQRQMTVAKISPENGALGEQRTVPITVEWTAICEEQAAAE